MKGLLFMAAIFALFFVWVLCRAAANRDGRF